MSSLTRDRTINEGRDAAEGGSTSYTMAVGDQFRGEIAVSDHDWVAVELVADQDYVFATWGRGGAARGLGDPEMELYNAAGVSVAGSAHGDDDLSLHHGNFYPFFDYTPSKSGTYFVEVSAFADSAGLYTMQVAEAELTPAQIATVITEIEWGVPTPLSFDTSDDNTITYDISDLSTAEKALARAALEAWEMVADLDFVAVGSAADITFTNDDPGAFAGPDAYLISTGEILKSSVNVGTDWTAEFGTDLDSQTMSTYIHEVGHALGLAHPAPYRTGDVEYGRDNIFANDATHLTVMSYFSPDDNPTVDVDGALALSPMMADVIAIQSLYGAPKGADALTAGNTVWGGNATLGGYLGTLMAAYGGGATPSNVAGDEAITYTITDAGGTDTLDLRFANTGSKIDLRPGTFSDVDGQKGAIAISGETEIERALAGSGNDVITGNDAANGLYGNGGNDRVSGGEGADTLDGGSGHDVLRAGAGADSVLGGSGNDTMEGESSTDILRGGAGNDSIVGGTGADTLYGGDGNDTMLGNTALDTLYGEGGDDYISSGDGVDYIHGGSGNDTLLGRSGWDEIHGGDGDDSLIGSAGDDELHGGRGDDYISAGSAWDVLYGNSGADTLYGNFGSDKLSGGAGNDALYGGTGDDSLSGGADADKLLGMQGRDVMEGGSGNDLLRGGTQVDRFIFREGHDADRINDFEVGGDLLELSKGLVGAAMRSGADVVDAHASIVNGKVLFDFGGGDRIELSNLSSLEGVADGIVIF